MKTGELFRFGRSEGPKNEKMEKQRATGGVNENLKYFLYTVLIGQTSYQIEPVNASRKLEDRELLN
jgi:hypothetical protein